MTQAITLMVVHSGEAGYQMPQFLLERDGVWFQIENRRDASLSSLRKAVSDELRTRSQPGQFSFVKLRAICYNLLYNWLLPRQLRDHLHEVLDASAGGDPPLLRIHSYPGLDWIPWELVWDRDRRAFLGCQFQIARLPIGPLPTKDPTSQAGVRRTVQTVYNLLGKGILSKPVDQAAWAATFSGLVPAGAEKGWLDGGAALTVDSLLQITGADIMHFTCHAKATLDPASDTEEVHWVLGDNAEVRPIDFAESLSGEIYRKRPLVFGNACASAGSIEADPSRDWGIVHHFPELATQMGAVAYVGTFARVNEDLAVEFAARFYQRLLGQNMPIAKALWQVKDDYQAEQAAGGKMDPSWLFYCLYGDPLTTFKV
jgi:hypothetical protein